MDKIQLSFRYSIYAFAKLPLKQKIEMLTHYGCLLDVEILNDTTVFLYSYNHFFIELIASSVDNKVKEVIPYKKGFKMNCYFYSSN